MAKKRTVIPRRKPPDAEARAASVQGDLFQAAAEASRDMPPPPQSLRVLGLAIKMEAGDTLETAPEGSMRVISATGEAKEVSEEADATTEIQTLKSQLKMEQEQQDTQKTIVYNYGTYIAEQHNDIHDNHNRSEEHTSELQSHSDISYAVFCLLFRSVLRIL